MRYAELVFMPPSLPPAAHQRVGPQMGIRVDQQLNPPVDQHQPRLTSTSTDTLLTAPAWPSHLAFRRMLPTSNRPHARVSRWRRPIRTTGLSRSIRIGGQPVPADALTRPPRSVPTAGCLSGRCLGSAYPDRRTLGGAVDQGRRLALSGVVLDSSDAGALADFYRRLLGWAVEQDEPGWVRLRSPDGGVGLSFQTEPQYVPPVWPARPGDLQMQVHS